MPKPRIIKGTLRFRCSLIILPEYNKNVTHKNRFLMYFPTSRSRTNKPVSERRHRFIDEDEATKQQKRQILFLGVLELAGNSFCRLAHLFLGRAHMYTELSRNRCSSKINNVVYIGTSRFTMNFRGLYVYGKRFNVCR